MTPAALATLLPPAALGWTLLLLAAAWSLRAVWAGDPAPTLG